MGDLYGFNILPAWTDWDMKINKARFFVVCLACISVCLSIYLASQLKWGVWSIGSYRAHRIGQETTFDAIICNAIEDAINECEGDISGHITSGKFQSTFPSRYAVGSGRFKSMGSIEMSYDVGPESLFVFIVVSETRPSN